MLIDVVRLISPLALGFWLLTIIGLLRQDRQSRLDLALMVVVWGLTSGVVSLLGSATKSQADIPLPMALTFAVASLPALAGIIVVLFPVWRPADQLYRGVADTKPRWLYRLWIAQAVIFGLTAVLIILFPRWGSDFILLEVDRPEGIRVLLKDIVRVTAPLWAVMSAASLYAAARSQEWSWRGLCLWFAFWQTAYVLTFVYRFDSHVYITGTLTWPTLIAGLALANVYGASTPLQTQDLAGETPPDGLLAPDLGSAVPMYLATLASRARAYHRVGVGASGTFRPSVDPSLPTAEFLASNDGPILCTVRFSNQRLRDDAGLDFRGCAVRLSRPGNPVVMDLVLSTGSFGIASSARQWATQRWASNRLHNRRLRWDHVAREAAVAGLRRAPDSYAALRYHSQVARYWNGTHSDGKHTAQLCRLRLIPATNDETGLPDSADEAAPWTSERRTGEQRSPTYLRTELEERLKSGTVHLRLQAQVHPGRSALAGLPDISDNWFDPAVDWDERTLPWVDVGELVLDQALPSSATELLQFASGNGGGVLVTPFSANWRDTRSVAAAQDRVMRQIGQVRLWLARLLGTTVP